MSDQIEESLKYWMAIAQGIEPERALIIDGPIRSKEDMAFWLTRPCLTQPDFFMSNAAWFEGRANVDDFPRAISWRRKHRPRSGRCFQNAQRFCLEHKEARYFEGFYLIFERPEEHAWVVMSEDKVLDFTHEAVIRKLTREKKEVHIRPPLYFGIEMPRNAVAQYHSPRNGNVPIRQHFIEANASKS